jgi:hypothetical protein
VLGDLTGPSSGQASISSLLRNPSLLAGHSGAALDIFTMTEKARVVLQDAQHAISNHTKTLQSESFRVSWFAIVGLLRAVGHVLVNVDAKACPAMSRAIHEKWEQLQISKPEPAIFWGFIVYERNRFLKDYEHGVSRRFAVPALVPDCLVVIDGGSSRGGEFAPGAEFDSFIVDGPYAGCYERDVAWQAHEWWESYLGEVDTLANSYQNA